MAPAVRALVRSTLLPGEPSVAAAQAEAFMDSGHSSLLFCSTWGYIPVQERELPDSQAIGSVASFTPSGLALGLSPWDVASSIAGVSSVQPLTLRLIPPPAQQRYHSICYGTCQGVNSPGTLVHVPVS